MAQATVNARPMTAQVLNPGSVTAPAAGQGMVQVPPMMAPAGDGQVVYGSPGYSANANTGYAASYYNWAVYVIWFLVAAVLTWIILYATKPAFVRVRVDGSLTDQLDTAKVLITSIIVGLIVLILVWLFRSRYN